jgi:5-methylcytosine-specific restriction endonuclease McrA
MRYRNVEGLIIDLTRIIEGEPFVLNDLIVHDISSVRVKVRKFIKHKRCDECRTYYAGAVEYMDNKYKCGLCRALLDGRITKEIYDIVWNEYTKPCSFCGAMDIQKHFDHINMFYKNISIGELLNIGCNYVEISSELVKCQILCVPCHKIVTRYESRYGFIIKKRNFNKNPTEELRHILAVEYEKVMSPFYEWLRRRFMT